MVSRGIVLGQGASSPMPQTDGINKLMELQKISKEGVITMATGVNQIVLVGTENLIGVMVQEGNGEEEAAGGG